MKNGDIAVTGAYGKLKSQLSEDISEDFFKKMYEIFV
jgi:hypothetical protein